MGDVCFQNARIREAQQVEIVLPGNLKNFTVSWPFLWLYDFFQIWSLLSIYNSDFWNNFRKLLIHTGKYLIINWYALKFKLNLNLNSMFQKPESRVSLYLYNIVNNSMDNCKMCSRLVLKDINYVHFFKNT